MSSQSRLIPVSYYNASQEVRLSAYADTIVYEREGPHRNILRAVRFGGYRWLSSRGRSMQNGTRSYSWIHVTGDRARKRAFLTEGPLKGDVASFLANDALFVCTGGVNAIKGLRETILALGVREVVEAMDMDQMTNPQVRGAILTMRREVQKIPGIKYSKYSWNPAYKGVDDYFLSRVSAL